MNKKLVNQILMDKKNIIIGNGGHARSLISLLIKRRKKNINIKAISKLRKNETIFNLPIVKLDIKKDLKRNDNFFLAIGDILIRSKYFNLLKKQRKLTPNIFSISLNMNKDLLIGSGNFIGENVFIGPNVKIGSNNIINTNSSIDHECQIGSNCNISPGVILAGRVKISDNSFIGMGVSIADKVELCKNIVIGANSFVNKSIKISGTYYGNPLKKIK
jgi:UDP-N-acetylbacillosamine N-acetyltransferase